MNRLRFFIEDLAARSFKKEENPFYFLGALSFFFFWVLLGTGIYLFFVYRLNIDGAYDSIQYLTDRQPYWGGIIRSLHRYAADGLIITMVLHGLRVFLAGQYRLSRWLAWVSGIIVIGVLWVEGILGYWMVWDNRAQFVALKSAEFLDILPIFGVSLPRAFLSRDLTTNLFFLIIIALHIVLPFIGLVILWLHVNRITKPVINPSRKLMAAVFILLLILSMIIPAKSGLRADPALLLSDLPMDWFYLAPYPLTKILPIGLNWLLLIASFIFLTVIPWLGNYRKPPPVSLVLKRCNDCRRCYEDCPYEAIEMRARSDKKPYETEPAVNPDLCVSCGICVGSCSTAALVLPEISMVSILTEARKRRSGISKERPEADHFVLLCEKALLPDQINEARVRFNPIIVPCIGLIHPTVIEQTIRAGYTRILLAGCREGDCHYRLGDRWLQERLARQRAPFPKPSFDPSKVQIAGLSPAQGEQAILEMERFNKGEQNHLRFLPLSDNQRPAWIKFLLATLILILPVLLIVTLSGRSTYSFYSKDESLLIVSFKYTASPKKCRNRTAEELEKLPPHMRNPLDCTRERSPVLVRLELDGKKQSERTYPPAGLWSDGPVFIYQKYEIPSGNHSINLTVQEISSGIKLSRSEEISLHPGRALIFDIVPEQKK